MQGPAYHVSNTLKEVVVDIQWAQNAEGCSIIVQTCHKKEKAAHQIFQTLSASTHTV
jgi:hypothetical protein